jgi:intein/homing endonuclease
MSVSLDLLQEIKDGAKALGIAPSTLCQRAVKNGWIVKRLEEGNGSVTLETANKIRAYIVAHRPKEAAE